MQTLPVREMVLYKHGVGFFVREGAVTGEAVTLTFKQDEINDILKSLAVIDQSGGQVLGIHYQTPMDVAHRLANTSIHLGTTSSLRDLLRDLRGRQATLRYESAPGTLENITGRIIGLDERPQVSEHETGRDTVSVLVDNQQVRVFPLDKLHGLTIQDEQSERDLSYFLDTGMSEDNRRAVTVRLSEGEHQLVVHYVAPSPTWRVSYRIIAESDEGGMTGKAYLQGWGIFDNRLEEDLEGVKVTLVAGQPISFIYDLYSSEIPERVTVRDEVRTAPPVQFAAAAAPPEMRAKREIKETRADISKFDALGDFQTARQNFADEIRASSPAITAAAKNTGEFFMYQVIAPVSVKRGESALVPIMGTEIGYERELLYNRAKLRNHPVVALRFPNQTGLTLERGPVTLIEDGDYKGEAVVGFTQEGKDVYIPYAVELGISVVEVSPQNWTEQVGLRLGREQLIYDEYWFTNQIYRIANTTLKDQQVTLEVNKNYAEFELFETPEPDTVTLGEQRWRLRIPAGEIIVFQIKRRKLTQRYEELNSLDALKLKSFFDKRWLDKTTFDLLSELLEMLSLIQKTHEREALLKMELNDIYARQEQYRANLAALQPTGQEANLRNRVLAQLEETQNRVEGIDREIAELTEQRKVANQRMEEIIAGLGEKNEAG